MSANNAPSADNKKSTSVPSTREEGTGTEQLLGNQGYDDSPEGPGLVGGPATDAIPGSRTNPVDVTKNRTPPPHAGATNVDDGGESAISGQPREIGGDRPK